jgi:hypothetical protein
MKIRRAFVSAALVLVGVALLAESPSLREQNEILLHQLQRVHGLSDAQMTAIRNIFAKSGIMSQGNPAVARHSVTPEEAQAKLNRLGID